MTEADPERRIRILIADDHAMLREGVAALVLRQPDMEVVGEAQNGAEALDACRRLRPDIALLDLQMPTMGGLEALVAIRREAPKTRVIVLTTYAGDAQAVRALRAGAAGYLLKTSLRKQLVETIRTVHAGQRSVDRDVAVAIALHAGDEGLTEREIQILKFIADGHANKQIARQLSVTEDTIKSHLKSIFAKLEVGDRTHAVTVAAKRGIIDL